MSYSMIELLCSNEWNIWLNMQVMFHANFAMRVRKVGDSESSYVSF